MSDERPRQGSWLPVGVAAAIAATLIAVMLAVNLLGSDEGTSVPPPPVTTSSS